MFPSFADGEIPIGSINGSNPVFTLAFAPSPAASLDLYRNGLLMKLGVDFTLNANVVTFSPASTPQVGDLLVASYRYGNPGNPLGTLTAAQVVCSSAGTSTNSTTLTQLGSCTIPAGLLGAGDRIEIEFQFAHSGTSSGFTGEIHWGGTTVFSRTANAGEAGLSGRAVVGLYAGAQSWDSQSFGNASPIAATLGDAAEDVTQNVPISLRGKVSASGGDNVILRTFTVIRYPAQANP